MPPAQLAAQVQRGRKGPRALLVLLGHKVQRAILGLRVQLAHREGKDRRESLEAPVRKELLGQLVPKGQQVILGRLELLVRLAAQVQQGHKANRGLRVLRVRLAQRVLKVQLVSKVNKDLRESPVLLDRKVPLVPSGALVQLVRKVQQVTLDRLAPRVQPDHKVHRGLPVLLGRRVRKVLPAPLDQPVRLARRGSREAPESLVSRDLQARSALSGALAPRVQPDHRERKGLPV